MAATSTPEPDAISKIAQVEDDIREIRKDVKKLAETLQLLVPQPKPAQPERYFTTAALKWVDTIRPTPRRLRSCVDLLLTILNRDKNRGHDGWGRYGLPTFANKMTLKVPELGNVHPGCVSPDLIPRLRNYTMSQLAIVSGTRGSLSELSETANEWYWDRNGFDFEMNEGRASVEKKLFFPWTSDGGRESLPQTDDPSRSHGTLCYIRKPAHHSVLDFRTLNFILAQLTRSIFFSFEWNIFSPCILLCISWALSLGSGRLEMIG